MEFLIGKLTKINPKHNQHRCTQYTVSDSK